MKSRADKRKITKIAIIAVICVALITALIVAFLPKEKHYDFSFAYSYFKEEKIDSPQKPDMVLTAHDVAGPVVIIPQSVSGCENDVAELEAGTVNSAVEFIIDVQSGGSYFLYAAYSILSDKAADTTVSLTVNNETMPDEFTRIPLITNWTYSGEFFKDSDGNDVLPSQYSIDGYINEFLTDYQSRTDTGLPFKLNKGSNSIRFELNNGKIYLESLTVRSIKQAVDYAAYKNRYKSYTAAAAEPVIIEAEKPLYKNDISILPQYSKDINTSPYESAALLLNTISLTKAGNAVTYEFEAISSGLYKIGFNYAAKSPNAAAFAKIKIDGEYPFGELKHHPFPYSDSFKYITLGNAEEDYYFFLAKGSHTLTIESDGVIPADITVGLKDVASELSTLYLSLKKLVGVNADKDREWDVTDYFPGIVEDFNRYIDVITKKSELYAKLNGSSTRTQSLVFLDTAVNSLSALLLEPDKIPNKVERIAENSDSIVQMVLLAVDDINSLKIDIDAIRVQPSNDDSVFAKHSGFFKFWSGVKAFFLSFKVNKNSSGTGDTVEIWVNRPLRDINVLQSLADAQFTAKTGIKVKLSLLKDEKKMVLTNAAGIYPDAVIGVSNWIPYELGQRGLAYDLRRFSNIKEVVSRFYAAEMIPFIIDDKILALPETQDATVLYYRKDILQQLNLNVPDTWEDVKNILPVLERNGMSFYLPLSGYAANKTVAMTAPFIYQYGGSLYGGDGMSAGIGSKEAIEGIKLMTELYIDYGVQKQVSSFPESFRKGTIPIGLTSLSMYSQLLVSAPELSGKWEIAVSPAGYNSLTGQLERWQMGGSTSCAVMNSSKNPDKAWQFLSWWMSDEVQSNYVQQIRSAWGDEFLWTSANKKAFNSSVYASNHKQVILKQWEWLFEVQRIPGWYMVERELSNAWNYIVFDGKNIRRCIDNAATTSNREIVRKLTEFGYMKNGAVIKEYKIVRKEEVEQWVW